MLDDLVARVQQRDARAEIRHDHITIPKSVEVARQVRSLDEIDVLAFQREPLNPMVTTIRDDEDRILAAPVEHDPVRAIQFSRLLAGPAERAEKLALRVVLINPARTVPVPDVNVAVRADGQIGRAVFRKLTVRPRLVAGRFLRVA